MDGFVNWAAFIGSWLLVGGPVFQASNELRKIHLKRHTERTSVPSRWLWFVPAVMYFATRHASRNDGPDSRDFRRVATGWFAVAAGGSLIAMKETWELADTMTWGILGSVIAYGIAFTVVQLLTSARMIVQSYQDRPNNTATTTR